MTEFNSTDDKRATNNVMRHQYKVLSETEKEQMQTVKDKALDLHEYLSSFGASRELSLARTKLEECVMWAVKDITG